jgi:REP element-mobilizing transposase RayT
VRTCYDLGVVSARKRHRQQELHFRTWGGKRKRAGRKQVNARKSQPHRVRETVHEGDAVHVTLRVADDLSRLRYRDAYRAVRKAMFVVLVRTDFRIVHASVQHNHIHLMVEAEDQYALARGMQAFQISAARWLNAAESKRRGRKRTGPVFPDRYYPRIVRMPLQARRALAYVLNNWRKHKEDRGDASKTWRLDPYSSAVSFNGWTERSEWDVPPEYEKLPVAPPQTWLLREGWRRHGTISVFEVPSRRDA